MLRNRVIVVVAGLLLLALAVWAILVLNAGETDSANGIQGPIAVATSWIGHGLPCT